MSRTRVLIVSFFAYPSAEVGAKRPSETANFLAAAGYDVTLVMACARGQSKERSELLREDVTTVAVEVPRKLISGLWLRLKSSRRSPCTADSSQPASSAEIPHDAATGSGAVTPQFNVQEGGGGTAGRGWLRRQILAADELFGGNKLWLTRLSRKLIRLSMSKTFDVVIASGPPKAGYIGGVVAARLTGAPLVLDFRDPWYLHGDGERSPGPVRYALPRFENWTGRYCVRKADHIVVASPGIERHLRQWFHVGETRVSLIRNGFDKQDVLESPGPVGRLALLYAGTLYLNRNPFPLFNAIKKLIDAGDVDRSLVKFRLVGQCSAWAGYSIPGWVAANNLSDVVEVLSPVDRKALRKLVADSNLLVNFAQGQPRQIPAKTYEYLAAGRDVLTITESDSDVARLFQEAGMGHVVSRGDVAEIASVLLSVYRRLVSRKEGHASPPSIESFSREFQLERFRTIIDSVVSRESLPLT